jgi:hypothetical protein
MVAIPVLPELHVPPETVELKVVEPLTQIPCVPLSVPAEGAAVTVTVLVAVASEQPPEPALVYVIVAVPAETPLITPVEELMVAIPVLPELHVPPETVELKVVEPLTQIPCVPLSVPAEGGAVTV